MNTKSVKSIAGLIVIVLALALPLQTVSTQAVVVTVPEKLEPLWNKTWHGYSGIATNSFAVDSSGIYVTGTEGTKDIVVNEIFLLKYDFNGILNWSRTWSNGMQIHGVTLAVYSNFIYIAGTIEAAWNGDLDILLLKYDFDGNEIWNKTWGGVLSQEGANCMVISGSIYTAGYYDNNTPLQIYVAEFSLDGNFIRNQSFGGSDPEVANGITTDGTALYITGLRNRIGENEMVVMKLGMDLSENWTTYWRGAVANSGHGITCSDSDIWVSGDTRGYKQVYSDVSIVKFAKNGTYLKNNTWGLDGEDIGYSICRYGTDLYIAGTYYDPVNYSEGVLLKFDSDCNLIWVKGWGDQYTQGFIGVSVDSTGIYIGGDTSNATSGNSLTMKTSLDSTNTPELQIFPAIVFIALVSIFVLVGIRNRRIQ
jgi:hypothetical protein